MTAQTTSQLANRVIIAALMLFALYSNIRIFIQNHQLSAQITKARAEIDQSTYRNKKLALLLNYYQSSSYQEVEARRRLGLKKPNETVLTVKESATEDEDANQLDSVYLNYQPLPPQNKPNWQQWWEYFFGN